MLTIEQFVEACKTLSNDEIYELYEHKISDDLRNQIIAILPETIHTTEPVRLRLNMLGLWHGVESLEKY